ncbi:MAG: response regulator, partial [Desulfuromusa sp.]|nr:response regulator [Desulfuromusa sp.]
MMKKLLLADDSITIQKVVGIILSTEGYQLEITDDGDRAFTKALEEVPDLVIADISMPGKDGFELCRAIKSEPTLANTSVLLLPGVFDHFDETKAGDVCADGWLTKPFESQALLDKVAQLLEAEPVQIAGTAVPEDEELSLETPVEATEVDIDTTVSEEILGL